MNKRDAYESGHALEHEYSYLAGHGAHHRRHQQLHRRAKYPEPSTSRSSRRPALLQLTPNGELQVRAIGDTVTATIDGQRVSWVNNYAGPGIVPTTSIDHHSPAEVALPSISPLAKITSSASISVTETFGAEVVDHGQAQSTESTFKNSNKWVREAYFNAVTRTSHGLTFLNHFGGVGGVPGTSAGGSAFVISTIICKVNRKLNGTLGLALLYPTHRLMASPALSIPKSSRMVYSQMM